MVKRVNGEKVFTLMTGKRILVVEDDRRNREALKIYLGGKGFDVTTATNGEEALEAVRQAIASGSGFDVYITDVNMPRMDGITFLEELRRRGIDGQTPIIYVTANVKELGRLRALEPKPVGILAKPYSLDVMLEAVQYAAKPVEQVAPAITTSQTKTVYAAAGLEQRLSTEHQYHSA